MKRRTFLIGSAAFGASALGLAFRNPIASFVLQNISNKNVISTDALGVGEPSCIVTATQMEGPYYLEAPIRSDVREDRDGLSLALKMQIVDAATCAPIDGAVVQLWHCDASGRYSGYPEDLVRRPFDTIAMLLRHGGPRAHVPNVNDKTYLRGAQVTDNAGFVDFQTILPGWYEPRLTHMHIKVLLEGNQLMTTQLYFDADFLDQIYGNHPAYKPHGLSPYRLENDLAYMIEPDGTGLILNPQVDGDGLTATCKIGIA